MRTEKKLTRAPIDAAAAFFLRHIGEPQHDPECAPTHQVRRSAFTCLALEDALIASGYTIGIARRITAEYYTLFSTEYWSADELMQDLAYDERFEQRLMLLAFFAAIVESGDFEWLR